jgi:DNA-binding beta-propeller fold protein YncE
VGGNDSGHADGLGAAATFSGPSGLVVDGLGSIYVADTQNYLIRKLDPSGNVNTMTDGGSAASVLRPNGVALDAAGNLYIADRENNRIQEMPRNK